MRIDAIAARPAKSRRARSPAFGRLTRTIRVFALACAWGTGSPQAGAVVVDVNTFGLSSSDGQYDTMQVGVAKPGSLWVIAGRLTVNQNVLIGARPIGDYFGDNPYQPDDHPDAAVHVFLMGGELALGGALRSFDQGGWLHLAGGALSGTGGRRVSVGRILVYDNGLRPNEPPTRYVFGDGDEIFANRLDLSPTLPARMWYPSFFTGESGVAAPAGAGFLTVRTGATVSAGAIRVGEAANRTGLYEQEGGRVTASRIDNWGTFRWTGGTFIFDGGLFTNQGLYQQWTGTLQLAAGLAHLNTGRISLRGPARLVLDADARLGGAGFIDGDGTVSGAGFIEGGILNRGTVEATGALTVAGGLDTDAAGKVVVGYGARLEVGTGLANAGILTVDRGTLIVQGATTNTGEIRVQSGSASFNGRFENIGTYRSDPSTQTFADLIVGDTGVIVAGEGDRFRIRNDFVNLSTQSTAWDTDAATLELLDHHAHQLTLAGIDHGAHIEAFADNFAWGELVIGADAAVLFQGRGDGTPRALYVHAFQLAGGLDTLAGLYSDSAIYYDRSVASNAYLGGRSYQLAGGGMLIASVPEASTVTMTGMGLAALGTLAWRRRRVRLAAA